jgi:hypothetical protein
MLLSTTPLSKIRPINPEQDSLVKTKLLIDSMNRSPAKRSDFILIRVVHGGDRSPQLEKFQTAFCSFSDKFNENVKIKIEYIGPKEIGRSRCMPTELIDWLLESSIPFIVTHINQGRSSHGIWCMRDMLEQLNRLYYHLIIFNLSSNYHLTIYHLPSIIYYCLSSIFYLSTNYHLSIIFVSSTI